MLKKQQRKSKQEVKPREKTRFTSSTPSEESDSDLKFTGGDSDSDNPDYEIIEGDFVVVKFKSAKSRIVHYI